MKEKIAFPQLVELVGKKANTTNRMSELFLQELFAIITHTLESGQSVKIKGLGSFKVIKGDDGKEVIFTPDKDLAEVVNAPFAQFKPVELSDEITQAQLDDIDASMVSEVKQELIAPQKELHEKESELITEPMQNKEPEPNPNQQLMEQAKEEAPQLSVEAQKDFNESKQSHKKLWPTILAIIGLTALLTSVFLHHRNQSVEKAAPALTDSVKPETKRPIEESETITLKATASDTAMSNTIAKEAKSIATHDRVHNIKKSTKTTRKHYRHNSTPKSQKGKISKHSTMKPRKHSKHHQH